MMVLGTDYSTLFLIIGYVNKILKCEAVNFLQLQ